MIERGELYIEQLEDSSIKINIDTTHGDIWLTKYEIAYLFQVYLADVKNNLFLIFKRRELYIDEVSKEVNGIVFYNLDVIITLAFRCKGPICQMFRIWIRNQAKRPLTISQPVVFQIGESSLLFS